MAEFQEVCRQALRMNETIQKMAGRIPHHIELNISSSGLITLDGLTTGTPKSTEELIMKWAAEHPESRYPSWKEAWRQAFPNGGLVPCPMHFDARCKPDDCSSCSACKDRPIPADIAEKLGIKPIGGSTDEKA